MGNKDFLQKENIMDLNLRNPLVFFDLETTGTDTAKDRIVEISVLKVNPNGTEETRTRRVNPEMPIPAGATAVHGISDEDVADAPTFKKIAKSLADFMEGCDVAGFNSSRFDIPLLAEEFLRAGIDFDFSKRKMIDVQIIFHKREQRTLEAALKFYCGKELDNAHSAEADTRATYEVLKGQLDMYPDIENDIDYLAKEFSSYNNNVDLAGRIIYNEDGVEVFNFGKHKGKSVVDILKSEPSFFAWIMDADFPLNTKQVLTRIKLREMNR